MTEERRDNSLHLPSLSISRFRGIDGLTIERLGRVTLLAGKNSVGKTTVLDAVRVYAAKGHYAVLHEILERNDEVAVLGGSGGEGGFGACLEAIFNGRDASKGASFSIGPKGESRQLQITAVEDPSSPTWQVGSWVLPARNVNVSFQGQEVSEPFFLCPYLLSNKVTRTRTVYQSLGWSSGNHSDLLSCQSLGPGLLEDKEIVERWDAMALTPDEEQVVNALRPILGEELIRIALSREERPRESRVLVKLRDGLFPVPLKSLGDGAMRLFGLALTLVNSRDGLLLIDEAENGIHHSVQRDLWRMVLQAAKANNVQVLATTHSFDCVRGFAQAVTDFPDIEGALVRLERKNGEMWAVEYSESDLKIAAEQSIEVR